MQSATTKTAWAKLDQHGNALPLEEHAADVAAIMRFLLSDCHWAHGLAGCAEHPTTQADGERLVALAFLHDLGKANRGFWRRQNPGAPIIGHTNETAALFYPGAASKQPAALALKSAILNWGAADHFAAAMAHHGRPLIAYASLSGVAARQDLRTDRRQQENWEAADGYDPMQQLAALLDHTRNGHPVAFTDSPPLPSAPAYVSLFCGLLTLADWLGSDTDLFPVVGPYGAERRTTRAAAVVAAVRGRGLDLLATPPVDFACAFGGMAPRGMQIRADDQTLGSVALLEAETGSGKTEAALWRWLALRRAGLVDGLYFALPTRSAAVQLHGRVQAMLGRVFGNGAPEAVLAVPGYLRAGDAEGQALPEFRVSWSGEGEGDGRWAAERPKRFLAARVAVGTTDQVLMSGLKLRHAHLRAACLSRSLLVIDEVHASDAFMGAILERVLANHCALGGHAMLLSATLAAEARGRLLGRQEPETLAAAIAEPYPALSGSARRPAGGGVVAPGKRVRWWACPLIDDPAAIAARAVVAARSGASVLVVRNSVAGAIAVAQAIEAAAPELAFLVNGVSTLHHGRFAPDDRRLLDRAVETAFGKGRTAQGRVLCGTQTLEQSLDLDADLLITDLAPVDVLLQRIGRLHRHPRDNRGTFAAAQAIVLVPGERDLSEFLGRVRDRHGLGPRANGSGVYPDLLTLEATLRLIEDNPAIDIPRDNRRLVEGALHPEVRETLIEQLGTRWMNHHAVIAGTRSAERQQAAHLALDLTQPFDTLVFPDLKDEVVTVRLGLRDRSVEFDPPLPGPFGRPVARLTVPGWMAVGVPPDAMPERVEQDAAGFTFRLCERAFVYGRFGLEAAAGHG